MAQTPKKIRRLPKNITKLTDREVMRRIFGKRVMRELDTIVAERSQDADNKGDLLTMDKG